MSRVKAKEGIEVSRVKAKEGKEVSWVKAKELCTYIIMNDLPHSPHAAKGGDRLGIYLIVEVMTLPVGPIYWVNPHIYFVRMEGKRIIRVAHRTTIYLSLKCSPQSKKRPSMYLL